MVIEGTNSRYLFYRPLTPRLVDRKPDRPLYLGLHSKGFDTAEFIAAAHLPVNLIEVKPEHFQSPDQLFRIRRGRVEPYKKNIERLVTQAAIHGLALQFHFPDRIGDQELNPGIVKHHPLIISYFRALAEVIGEHDLSPNVTFHPPLLYWGERRNIPGTESAMERAIRNTRALFLKLAVKHAAESWPIRLGVENQSDPTPATHILGYRTEQLEAMTATMPGWINFTLDSGHGLLSKGMSLQQALLPLIARLGKRVINIHFHENRGAQTATDHGDDHDLPAGGRIPDYLSYLNRAVQERAPLVLEVDHGRYPPEQMLIATTGIRTILEQIEEESAEPAAKSKTYVIKEFPLARLKFNI